MSGASHPAAFPPEMPNAGELLQIKLDWIEAELGHAASSEPRKEGAFVAEMSKKLAATRKVAESFRAFVGRHGNKMKVPHRQEDKERLLWDIALKR